VVPRRGEDDFPGYTTEEQAADYPPGQYELSLQTAAEAGDQQELSHLFSRRSSGETVRLGVMLALVLSLVVLVTRWWMPALPESGEAAGSTTGPREEMLLRPAERERAAIAAAVVGSASPWTSIALTQTSAYRQAERVATAAGIIASQDPWTAAVQIRAANARYAEIWKQASE
jgi:hypothetical protein